MARKPSAPAAKPAGDKLRILVLQGPEEMVKREHLDRLRLTLADAHGQFETTVFDGKTVALADVLDELRSMSLMQQYKLVIVDDADLFLAREDGKNREPMERYAAAPVDTATLVFRANKWNKGNLDKLIEKVGEVIKCEPMKPHAVPGWVTERARAVHERKIDPKAASLLAERLGGDLSLIDNELAKLALMADEKGSITTALVEQLVGRSSEEEAWSVQEAVLAALADPRSRATGQLIDKIHELIDLSGQPDILVCYFVADLLRKLYLGLLMRKQGVSDFEIGKEFKLWGPRQEAFMRVLRKLEPAAAGRLFDRIVDLDVRAKSGRGEAVRNLECFCAALGDEV